MARSRYGGKCIHGKWWKYDKNGKLVPTIWPCVAQEGDPYYVSKKKIASIKKPVKNKKKNNLG